MLNADVNAAAHRFFAIIPRSSSIVSAPTSSVPAAASALILLVLRMRIAS